MQRLACEDVFCKSFGKHCTQAVMHIGSGADEQTFLQLPGEVFRIDHPLIGGCISGNTAELPLPKNGINPVFKRRIRINVYAVHGA